VTDPQEHHDPDVVSPDMTEPPPQPPTQPSMEARPDLLPPAHPPQAAPPVPSPPAPYAPPTPPRRNRTGTLLLVIAVAVLMIAGGTAGYLMLGGTDEASIAVDEATEPSEEAAASPEPSESPAFEFPGETIPVASLGAEMPVPSANWELQAGPGEDGADMDDMASYVIQYEEDWYANILVGRYNVAGLPFDPNDMEAAAVELTGFWAEQAAAGGENGTTTQAVAAPVTVDGRPGVIAEAAVSWDATEFSDDKHERVLTFLVDVDGVDAFYAQAWIPESADAEYEAVVAAFRATVFDA
jgi:hypothetical protein